MLNNSNSPHLHGLKPEAEVRERAEKGSSAKAGDLGNQTTVQQTHHHRSGPGPQTCTKRR